MELTGKIKLVKETHTSNVQYAAYMLGARYIEACDNGDGYFGGEGNICDQEGCGEKATILAKKKFDYCRDGHKSESPSSAFRMFCDRHSNRGDCGMDDSDMNYDKAVLL